MADDRNGIDEFQNEELLFTQERIAEEVVSLINVIELYLASFPYSTSFKKILKKSQNENKHSEAFCDFMTQKTKGNYTFMREQKSSVSPIDIGVLWNSIVIFTIEAKVLPMPEPKKIGKTRDEHEYVYKDKGKGAGIERFKENAYGYDNDGNFLLDNGMIAYITEKDFVHWHTQVNQWIIDAGWGKSEKLKPKYPNQPDKYISEHQRGENDSVKLHHFWVKVSANA